MFRLEVKLLPEHVVALMATFYLLDFDYPKQYEIGMNVLQCFVFEDNNVQKILLNPSIQVCHHTNSLKLKQFN